MARRVRWLPLLLLLPSPLVAAPPRAGGEFRVNSYTTATQWLPAAAADAAGRFVVVWESYGQDGSDGGVFGQRYDAAGNPIGGEFQVNVYTPGRQFTVRAAAAPTGGFMVTWTSALGPSGGGLSIMGRRFDAGGAASSEFQVSTDTINGQFASGVAVDGAGNAVVVWQANNGDGSMSGVKMRRFDATGAPLGGEVTVNVYTTYGQGSPSVAAHPDGSFVVAWSSVLQDGSLQGVFGRRFDTSGAPVGGEFAVNTYTSGAQRYPHVAAVGGGAFVVAWESELLPDHQEVFARRFDATAMPLGPDLQLNAFATGRQGRPQIAADGTGGFLAVWESEGVDGHLFGVAGRSFDAAGTAAAEFAINTFTTSNQRIAAVAADADGRFVVAWFGSQLDPSGYGVRAQRFGDLIFKDGLESGGLGAWSSSGGGGDLSANGGAALAGTTVGLQAVVNDTDGLFVQDDSPADEGRYRARFYLDTNGFDAGEAQSHFRTRTLIAFTESPTRRVAAVVLRRIGSVYAVMGRARRDDNTQANTGFFTIADGEHAVEIELVRATDPDANDGALELWIDGASMIRLTGLDNSLAEVDFARMGALSVKTGAGGTLFFDEFESRRQSYVGLLP